MLNNIGMVLFLAIILVTVVSVSVIVVIPKATSKGINVAKAIVTAQGALNTSNAIIKVADTLLPTNPAIDILQVISSYATKAVKGAEQLYLTSKLEADQRNIKAKEIVNSALTVLKVEVTPDIQKVIDGAIEAEVLLLPKVVLTDAQKQQAVIQLQNANAQLVAQNLKLTQTIAQFKSVAATV